MAEYISDSACLFEKFVNIFRTTLHKSEFGNHLILVNRSFLFFFLRPFASRPFLLKYVIV